MPQISVIVPVYNVEAYIHCCVDSILAQTFPDFELILVDDGSPDHCPVICDGYAEKDDRIHVIHQENGGLSAARNAGIDMAKGEFLTFVDSDDVIHPQFLERLINNLEKNNCGISTCQFLSFTDDIEWQSAKEPGETCLTAVDACVKIYERPGDDLSYAAAWGKIYRCELFQDLRYPVGRLHEDQFVTYKLMYAANKVGVVNEPLYGYRTNPTSIMNSTFSIKRYDALDGIVEAKEFFQSKGEDAIVDQIQKRINGTTAANSFQARKSGIYHQVKDCYKISKRKALEVLVKEWGQNDAEYFVSQYYPNDIKCRSIMRKIKSMLMRA